MSLTVGTGPFGQHPRGKLNFEPPEHIVYVEPWPRRVRALAGDIVVVDSERTVLVYTSGRLPRYAFPAEDVSVKAEPEPEVEGYVRVPWSAADRWLEEDEEVIVHPHDPYHRIEVLRSSRSVRIRVNGEPVAESTRPRILFETGLPPRYYLSARSGYAGRTLLKASIARSRCSCSSAADICTRIRAVPSGTTG